MATLSLLKVSLRECDTLTDEGVGLLAEHSPNLQCVDISKCGKLSGASLRHLSKVGFMMSGRIEGLW